MRILLVYPNPTQESPQRTPPLSILYLGAYVARRGHTVTYFDERWDSPADFDHLLSQADIVGVSAMSGYQLGRALHYLKLAHAATIPTILGGVHCTIAPETCFNEADYLVIGEGEQTLLDLLNALDSPRTALYDSPDLVPGVITSTSTAPPRPDMEADAIESPVDPQTLRYFQLASLTDDVALPSSRGCPYSCTFCLNSARAVKKWRALPLDAWTTDIDYLLNHGVDIKFFQVGDDWIGPEKRIIEIAHILQARGIRWHPSLRVTQINDHLAATLAASSCEGVSIGVESGDPAILELMDKQITPGQVIRGAEILAHYKLRPFYLFIVGLPTETTEQMHRTFDLADKLYAIHKGECSLVFYAYCPQPGTKLYQLSIALGYPMPTSLQDWVEHTRSNTPNPIANAIYHIAGLTFHRKKGDKTDRNFPHLRRLLILPLEALCVLRWRHRWFKHFSIEKAIINFIINRCKKK